MRCASSGAALLSSPSSRRTQQQGVFRRALGAPILFAIVYTSVASAIYFSLGVVADHALGLTPVVFLVAGLFFVLTTMTYVEGASLHQDRAGATVFARYAFNELWSFVAGWAILLDFLILIAVTSLVGDELPGDVLGRGRRGRGRAGDRGRDHRLRRGAQHPGLLGRGAGSAIAALVIADIALQLAHHRRRRSSRRSTSTQLTASIDLGTTPTWEDFIFALTVGTVAFTGLESASGPRGRGRRRPPRAQAARVQRGGAR